MITIGGALMNILRPLRLFFARRPWVYWAFVLVLAAGVAAGVRAQLVAVDDSKRLWADTRTIWVAADETPPGESIEAIHRELPLIAVPHNAVNELDVGTVARQHISAGEPIVIADVTVGRGPAAGARDGQVVVPISDPLLATAPVGVDVSIYADGLVLASDGLVVHVDNDVIFVAVDESDGPIVAAAAQLRSASIVFTR